MILDKQWSVTRVLRGLAAFVLAATTAAALAAGAVPGGWQRIQPAGPVTGLDGLDHVASCAGYPGTNPAFEFWTRKGKSRNLVVYFEGGGACWDSFSCSFPYAGQQPTDGQFY